MSRIGNITQEYPKLAPLRDTRKDPKKIRRGAPRRRPTWKYSEQYMKKFGEIRQELPRFPVFQKTRRDSVSGGIDATIGDTPRYSAKSPIFLRDLARYGTIGGFGASFRYLERHTKTLRIESRGAPTTFHAGNLVGRDKLISPRNVVSDESYGLSYVMGYPGRTNPFFVLEIASDNSFTRLRISRANQ